MKTLAPQTSPIFTDRPLPELPRRSPFASLRELTRVEQTDYLDPLLQAALVLCLMGSLALCALQSGASSDRTTPYPQARPALAATCHLPAAAAPGRVLSAIRF